MLLLLNYPLCMKVFNVNFLSLSLIHFVLRVMLATISFEHSLNTHSFINLNHCGSTLWKLNLYKMVGHTLISSN